jgi:DNA-binding CsgD family transcriptional regulator
MPLLESREVNPARPDFDSSEQGARNTLGPEALAGARLWAINEVGAAILHQLVEPLTALLLYMHELKECSEAPTESARREVPDLVKVALRETERVCAIMEQIGNRFEGPPAPEDAVSRGRDAIMWWSKTGRMANDAPTKPAPYGHETLTLRERDVLHLISGGATNKEGALSLNISPRTFESHRAHIMRKIGARNTADLLRKVLGESR